MPNNLAGFITPILFALGANAMAQSFDSGPEQVSLLELYTSQGCSSCPPADRWLSGLKQDPRLWSQVVPVAFHVDYWDRLGWKDPHARPQHSQRQRRYQRTGGVSSVYTPGFVVAGREWRGWFSRPDLEAASGAAPGTLRIELEDGLARGRYIPAAGTDGELTLHVAWLGFDLDTPVPAGENSGRTLTEDFVVQHWRSAHMRADGDAWAADIRMPASAAGGRRALAAWISRADNPQPLQSTGGWLEP